ncbi:MAG TPA: M20/M25/M40 family metallo-hydrolase [Candidatus Acidoferrum sp.]|nr:M20/M25/M40 family metallo-hydrolase [Candidatus Acidoferrum sp.]
MTKKAAGMWILGFLAAAATGSIYFDRPPGPLPTSAAPAEFSAARALDDLHAFARAPHPIGSQEHDRVRDYLVAQLTALGGNPEVQRTTGVTALYQVAGSVENIVARWKGTSGGSDAIGLVAHYDSVAAGPGAGDDGSGVAAILEAMRALRTGPPPRNDIVVLFTDGEEAGLLGASAFAAEHPWAKDIRAAVNLDSRGTSGPSQLFETSPENGRLIGLYAASARHPYGSSLTYEVYKRLPNDTDMTIFKKAGIAVMNFGFIGNWEAYHTPLDNPEALDPGSLQQSGENVLSLARALGNADLTQLRERDAVFASIPPGIFFHYSGKWAWPLTGLCAAVFVAVAFWANGAFQTRWRQILAGFLSSIGILALFAVVAMGFTGGVYWLHAHRLHPGRLLQSVPYLLSLFALLAATYAALQAWLSKRISAAALSLGGLLVVLAGAAAATLWTPGVSVVIVWPLLFSLAAIPCAGVRAERPSACNLISVCLCSVPALLVFVPLLRGFFTAMGFARESAPALGACFAFLAFLLGPLMGLLSGGGSRVASSAALAACVALFGIGARSTSYTAQHPKATILAYALDGDTGKAFWASSGSQLDPWTEHYLGPAPAHRSLPYFYPPWLRSELLVSDARAVTLEGPEAELAESSAGQTGRTLHLRIVSRRHAPQIRVFATEGAVLDASVNGHRLGMPAEARWKSGSWGFDYANLPAEGVDLLLHTSGNGPVRLMVTDQSPGLPEVPGTAVIGRPPECIPMQWGDATLVRRSFVF